MTPCKCEKRKNPTCGQLLAEGKLDEPTTPAPTPWSAKEGYWYEQYQLMRERYHRQLGDNTERGVAIRELEEQLKAKHSENRELYAMLGHIVDWSPELPFYIKDEYKVLFKNALAAARELLSKCKVEEGK